MCGFELLFTNVVEGEEECPYCKRGLKNSFFTPSVYNELFSFTSLQSATKGAFHLQERGPDGMRHSVLLLTSTIEVHITASVLHLRGEQYQEQPIVERNKNGESSFFVWNGEIFGGVVDVRENENDTLILFNRLQSVSSVEEVIAIIHSVEGPCAFVYFHAQSHTLLMGRDVFGRRSFVVGCDETRGIFRLSSTACVLDPTVFELPAVGTWCLTFSPNVSDPFHKLCLTAHEFYGFQNTDQLYELLDSTTEWPTYIQRTILRHQPLQASTIQQETFGKFCEEILLASSDIASIQDGLDRISKDSNYKDTLHQFLLLLSESVRKRVTLLPRQCRDCASVCPTTCGHARVALLFSGGLDSTVLALLMHTHVPPEDPIDLLNVAFSKPNSSSTQTGMAPDRASGLSAFQELLQLCPGRSWNFVHIDVPLLELQETRSVISPLIYPKNSVLDDSLGCALWFAARGRGQLIRNEDQQPYSSPAKVLLVGSGADELLAGYSRHRAAFQNGGATEVEVQLRREIRRIFSRNLGRDDRIISDHGREARMPFLDEQLVAFLEQLPVNFKATLALPQGLGDKLLLRSVAWTLGLRETAVRRKRALQFGSQIAKLENRNEKGSDKCDRLQNTFKVYLNNMESE